jgi:DNA-binding CsgD family transcriptional regulator
MPDSVKFTRREREILELTCLGSPAKHIAAELEISLSTVNSHLARICMRARVTRQELVIYVLQHRAALQRGGMCTPGLHPVGCPCEETYCKGMRRAA